MGHTHLDNSVDAKQTGHGACDTQSITDCHSILWEIAAQYCLEDVIEQDQQTFDRWYPEITAPPSLHFPLDYSWTDAKEIVALSRLPHNLARRVILPDCNVLPWSPNDFSIRSSDVSPFYVLYNREDISGLRRRHPNTKGLR